MKILLGYIVWLILLFADYFIDVSRSHLPIEDLGRLSMDAASADFDGDGDLDIIIANEHRPNIYLENTGEGKFINSSNKIPQVNHDSEDIGIADFDSDGDLDILVVSEDDKTNELYLNNGDGTFSDAGGNIPVDGTSNGVLVIDINVDGHQDIVIANNGQNMILINDGKAVFRDESKSRLPSYSDISQSVAAGDIDNDGDNDLIFANEDNNRVLINSGNGHFKDESDNRIPYRNSKEESREVDLADLDGDGDLDIFFGNVEAFVNGADRQNRLLLNNGKGVFEDVTESNLPPDQDRTFTGTFFDIDKDGDLDLITGNVNGDRFDGNTPFRVYENDGAARFHDSTTKFFPESVSGRGFDIEIADFNGDGKKDMFFANRGTEDILIFAK